MAGTFGCDDFEELRLSHCSYAQVYQRILHTPVPQFGHVKSKHEIDDENDDHNTEDIVVDEGEDERNSLPVPVLKCVLVQALAWYFTRKSMNNLSETAHIQLDQVLFMLSTSSDLFTSIMFAPNEEEKIHKEHLDQVLKSWNLKRQMVPPDGNCLFYSVAHNLKMQLEMGNCELEQILMTIGIDGNESLAQMARALRTGVVKEWIGKHLSSYQLFMTQGQLHSQAEDFRQDCVYSSDIGDLVITALSNMLQTALVVFTSRPHQPIHVQHPTHSPMKNPYPIHLAYLQLESGHYDAVVPRINTTSESNPTTDSEATSASETEIFCSCGRKRNER